jgi:1-acyl-sn-glycerol-3-phosphate acyltransferase
MLRNWIGKSWLKLFGWRLEGTQPPFPKKFVFLAVPHTSNWDVPFMLAAAYVLDVRISWMGKHTLFEGPFGWAMRALGGLPVDRRAPQGLVQQVIDLFGEREELILGIPAEGTRRRVKFWKSGFYRIALGAGVPICLGFLDFEKKRCGLGPFLMPTGDVHADMEKIRAFYRDIRGKHPELESEPRLKEEG